MEGQEPEQLQEGLIILYHGTLAELNSLGIGKYRVSSKLWYRSDFYLEQDQESVQTDLRSKGLAGLVNMRSILVPSRPIQSASSNSVAFDTLGSYVRKDRKSKKMSQAGLAEEINEVARRRKIKLKAANGRSFEANPEWVMRLEGNKFSRPFPHNTLVVLAEALGARLEEYKSIPMDSVNNSKQKRYLWGYEGTPIIRSAL